ncbi:MAG: Cys-tRNA(Pro) deacylase [Synergistaceae bacterium]|nr:Cys-tRNA(Pro) deacylase [Synergistaceae bacterium]
MKDKITKTNVIRILDAAKAKYELLSLNLHEAVAVNARKVAEILNKRPEEVFKTLVTVGKSKEHYVFVVPGSAELDLRKAAKVVGEKSIEMIHAKELLPLTGYVHGGCSPVGMKKYFKTVIDASAGNYETITISAGRIGLHMELSLDELRKVIEFSLADIADN